MNIKHGEGAANPASQKESTKYRDRPADEGKHGDASEEPNSGVPTSTHDLPERAGPTGNHQ